jgi:Ser/Thr protein kinase RdoA (MazF antagonist)
VKLSPVVLDHDRLVDAVSNGSGVQVRIHRELDLDVYRVGHDGPGPDWVVRCFDDTVGRAAVDTAAQVLAALQATPFPAERCPLETPVITFLEDGSQRHLMVTEYVEARPAPKPGFVLAWCGGLLGRLATRSVEELPPGGGWHRLGPTPPLEIDAALRLTSEVGGSASELLDLLAGADDADGLPEGQIHPDMTPPNAIPQGESPPVVIDWLGVGRGPRIWALAFLLFAAGPRAVRAVLERYRRSVTITDEEWRRLPDIMLVRPLTLDVWSMAYERLTVDQAIIRSRQHRARVQETISAAEATR